MRTLAATVLVTLVASASFGQARALEWSHLSVNARLDADGALHIVERQWMIFSGNWNGGEREFRLEPGHELTLHHLFREDPELGPPVELEAGTLDEVDHYDWAGRHTLRWRSRLPSDPIFDNDEITYVLDYTLANVLVPRGDTYVLDHDFAFADRVGAIERFTLELDLDPIWVPLDEYELHHDSGPLPPGQSFVLELELGYAGSGRPASVIFGATAADKRAVAIPAALAVFGIVFLFSRREAKLGRFDRLPPVASIDEPWIERHVLTLLPEEVGAVWDDRTAAPEVAAILARLVVEGKLASKVTDTRGWIFTKSVLHLRRLVPESAFTGYEASLIRALFFHGRDHVDTETLRKHYRSRGFHPVSRIRRPLERRARKLFRPPSRTDVSPAPTLVLAMVAALAIGASCFFHPSDRGPVLVASLVLVAVYLLGFLFARSTQNRVDHIPLRLLLCVLPTVLVIYVLWWFFLNDTLRLQKNSLAGLSVLAVALVNSLWNAAKFRKGPELLAARKRLLAGRRWFARELARAEPRLQDAWFPYVVAFGLERQAERWFNAYGGHDAPRKPSWSTGPTPSRAGTSRPPWTGGGGAFGGAGASGSWSSAASSVARGVSRPSSGSSSGGSSSSSSSSSSGGGGGGGW